MIRARKTRLPAAAAVLILALPSPAGAAPQQGATRTKDLSRTLPVRGRAVAIDGYGMELRVEPATGDEAAVAARLEYWSSSQEWMRAVAENYDVEIRESAGRVEIDFPEMSSRDGGGWLRRLLADESRSWSIEVTLTVPAGTALEIDNRYGSVKVAGVGGDLTVHSASGPVEVDGSAHTRIENTYAPVRVSGVTGDVQAEVGSGALTIRNVTGDVRSRNTYARATIEDVSGRVDHETSSGEVAIRRVAGSVRVVGSYGSMEIEDVGDAELRNGSGAVTVNGARGDVRIANSYAPVRARRVAGSLVVDSSSASVQAEDVGGDVEIVTSYDGVQVRGIGGALSVRNGSGRVSAEGFRDAALTASHVIETSYAGIDVVWPAGAPVDVTAECSYGEISTDLGGAIATSGARQTLRLEAQGGARLRLVSSSGAVRIRKG